MWSIIGFFILLVVAAVCGSIGAHIAGQPRRGCLVNIAIGFIGAIIGSWLAIQLHMPYFFRLGGIPIIWAILGAALFMAVVGLISGVRR